LFYRSFYLLNLFIHYEIVTYFHMYNIIILELAN